MEPGRILPSRLQRMAGDDFSDPSWRLEMARKDTGLFLKEAENKGVSLNVIPGVAKLMDEWIEKGHGKERLDNYWKVRIEKYFAILNKKEKQVNPF